MEQYGQWMWQDGQWIEPEAATTSIMTHAIHYGTGFFEGIRAYETDEGESVIFKLREHLERLARSCAYYHFELPYTIDELEAATIELVRRNGFKSCYIRPFVFMGTPWQALLPTGTKLHVAIACWQLGDYFDKTVGIRAKVASYRRVSPTMMPMQAKAASNYMNSQLLKGEALRSGFDEAIALDMNGNVSEASVANIFLVKGKQLITPSLDCSVLDGITRQTIMHIGRAQGYEVVERHIARDELYIADEVFLTGTAAEVTSVINIDHLPIGNGRTAVASELQAAYRDIVQGRDERYASWLTDVKGEAPWESQLT